MKIISASQLSARLFEIISKSNTIIKPISLEGHTHLCLPEGGVDEVWEWKAIKPFHVYPRYPEFNAKSVVNETRKNFVDNKATMISTINCAISRLVIEDARKLLVDEIIESYDREPKERANSEYFNFSWVARDTYFVTSYNGKVFLNNYYCYSPLINGFETLNDVFSSAKQRTICRQQHICDMTEFSSMYDPDLESENYNAILCASLAKENDWNDIENKKYIEQKAESDVFDKEIMAESINKSIQYCKKKNMFK